MQKPYIRPETMQDVMSEGFETFKQKNRAYGNSFENSLDKHGITAALVRMDDKMERLATLNKMGSAQVGDESIIDTAMDLGNYALMLACYLKGVRDHAAQDESTHAIPRTADSQDKHRDPTKLPVEPVDYGRVGSTVSRSVTAGVGSESSFTARGHQSSP